MARTRKHQNDEAASSAAPNALTLLSADHKAVQELFEEYAELCADEAADPAEKQQLANRICSELTVHAQIEEELFYPALREMLDDHALLDEAEVEHASATELIAQLQDMEAEDELYDAKVTVLGEYINHHIDKEQGELFAEAKEAQVDLQVLGRQLLARQQELKAEMGLEENEADRDDVEDEEEQAGDEGPGEQRSDGNPAGRTPGHQRPRENPGGRSTDQH